MGQYINLTQTFFDEYQGYTINVNQLNSVRTLNGLLVCDVNTINDFSDLFETEYDFLVVDETFYNQYNGMVLIPEKLYLFVRQADSGELVVENLMKKYFPTIFSEQTPLVRKKLTELEDFYVNLDWDDFDHSNDIE